MPEQTIFVTLPPGRKTWAVAAVHGEAGRLAALHARLAECIGADDNLVYLGNFLGRGDAVAETVSELLLFRRRVMAAQVGAGGTIAYLRGSQEEMWHKLLQIQFATNPREVLDWMLAQGVEPTLRAYGATATEARDTARQGPVALSQWTNRLRATMRAADGHDRLMSALRRAAYTEDHTLLFVNAGIDPARPLSEQTDTFWWGGRDFDLIDAPYGGFRLVVRGFDAGGQGVRISENAASIDGGCGSGGPLVCVGFGPDGATTEVIEA